MNKDEPPHPSLGDEVQVGDHIRVEWMCPNGAVIIEGEGVLRKYDVSKRGITIEYLRDGASCTCMLYGKTWAGHRELRKLND